MIFQEAPADFKKGLDVVGCYLEHDGKFVLLHRHTHKPNGNTFGLPAGKVDPGETIHQAMSREIREETGLDVPEHDLEHIASVFVRHDEHDFEYHMFRAHFADVPNIVIAPHEHQAYQWVSPAEALTLDLVHDQDDCIRICYGL